MMWYLDDGIPDYDAYGVVKQRVGSVLPGIAPRLGTTPGGTCWLGPRLGEYNHEIYGSLLELAPEQLAELQRAGII